MLKRVIFAAVATLCITLSTAHAASIVGWGDNTYGQLGNGGTASVVSSAVFANTLTGVSTITIGGYTSLAIQNGALYTWGYNAYGQLGNGTYTDSHTPIAVSSMASGVTAIGAGYHHSLAIKSGAAYAWGDNDEGQLGNYPGGYSGSNTPVAVYTPMTSGVTAVAGGSAHSLGIHNGSAYAWGSNDYGQLGNGGTFTTNFPVQPVGMTSGVTAVAGNELSSIALKSGAVYTWGNNDDGQLGNGTMGASAYSYLPVAAANLSSGVTAIAAGAYHNLAVKGGNVYAWGYNNEGQLGIGNTTPSDVPLEVDSTDLKNITQVAAGVYSSYALSSDGTVWDWGYNGVGQLGLGTSGSTSKYLTPQHLHAPSGYIFTSIAAYEGGYSVLATVVTLKSIGDFNGDGKVDVTDLGILASHWQQSGANIPGDANGDNTVDVTDLGVLASHWQFGAASAADDESFQQALAQAGLGGVNVPEPVLIAPLFLLALQWRRQRS